MVSSAVSSIVTICQTLTSHIRRESAGLLLTASFSTTLTSAHIDNIHTYCYIQRVSSSSFDLYSLLVRLCVLKTPRWCSETQRRFFYASVPKYCALEAFWFLSNLQLRGSYDSALSAEPGRSNKSHFGITGGLVLPCLLHFSVGES